jgi:AraC-like DNA-binding protein
MRENRRKFQDMWLQVSNKPEKDWTVTELCNYINLSRSQLSRICKDLYNKAPGEMVKNLKIDYAKVLLRNTTYPISVISDKIGYANSNNFSTAFKTIAKKSPQAFRKEYNTLKYFK